MALRWFPWRWVVSRVARARGLIDPVRVLSRLESFAQPLEVKEPLELLRAGLVFHARGLLNTGAIQHNLDWVWPFWVERQYDPHDVAFVPRAFSITHVNLTHRSWTAVGLPGCEALPVVDPRGLVTPFWDGWSLDAWLVDDHGRGLFPSRARAAEQRLELRPAPAVVTRVGSAAADLCTRSEVQAREDGPELVFEASGECAGGGWLVLALRPCNPEGVSFVHDLRRDADGWLVDRRDRVRLPVAPDRHLLSDYQAGDVTIALPADDPRDAVHCRVGMATAAALYRLLPGERRVVRAQVPLAREAGNTIEGGGWPMALAAASRLRVADPLAARLYDAALATVVLCSPADVYPGPYTYRRFWFRDAVLMLHGMLCCGLVERAERAIARFPPRQTRAGHFLSQDGEWDSNGQVLWLLQRFAELTGRTPGDEWRRPVRRAAAWIAGKRLPAGEPPHAGLLPAGFSAEHLGPNDFYYWDDFWSLAGLRSAAALERTWGDERAARRWEEEASSLATALDRSLAFAARRLGREAMPASPTRRLDSGAVGSLAAGYPLQLFAADDLRLLGTAAFLHQECLVDGGFFQDVIHSGVNPYLTLHLAEVFLRAEDPRFADLVRTVARLASPTGQWPEAVHPRTGGGCMGDGHHAWAAAEWLLLVRNAFVREEGNLLVLGGGVLPEWVGEEGASFGPAPTRWGPVTVHVEGHGEQRRVRWEGHWRGAAPVVRVPSAEAIGRRAPSTAEVSR